MHGTSAPGVSAGPNLTPLLDVVLQLLMFFIICTNFKMEEVSTEIKLPKAHSARPVDKSDVDVLFVNMDHEGKVLVLGREPMERLSARVWLRQQYEDMQRYAKDGTLPWPEFDRETRQVHRLAADETIHEPVMPAAVFLP